MTPLERDCYRVIAYFAVFHYPVTAFEVWKWLYAPAQPWTLCDIVMVLRESALLRTHVAEHDGMYGMGDVAAQCIERHARFLDAMRKYQRLMPIMAYLGRLPYVEGVAVCNSLALHFTNAQSDIDLFIVASPGRVWTVRFSAVAALAVLRLRPGEAVRDPVCCSFFVDRDLLAMEGLKIGEYDPYFAMWHATLSPLVDRGHVFARMRAENAWAVTAVPHAAPVRRARAYGQSTRRRLPLSPLSEGTARSLQERRLNPAIVALKNKDTRVVVNNKMLKFHENDRRAAIAAALDEKLASL